MVAHADFYLAGLLPWQAAATSENEPMTDLARIPLILLIVAAFSFASVTGAVVINEAQSSNASTLLDEDGDASDWIELLNTAAEPIDLAGWGLSDRVSEPFLWVFPQRTINPGERLLVRASGKNRMGTPVDAPPSIPPDGIPGLVLWLDAESEDFENGAAMGKWTDRSGRANHALAPDDSARPVFRTNRVNGRPALAFTRNSGHQLNLPTADFEGLDDLGNFTILAIAKWGGTASSGLFGAYESTLNDGSTHFEINSGGELRLRVAAMSDLSAPAALTAGEWCMIGGSMSHAGDDPTARLFKGENVLGSKTQSSGLSSLQNYPIMAIGTSHSSDRNFDGEIAEVLMYDRALQADERLALANHLASRYSLPGTSVPPQGAELHTNFSISADGEELVLTRPDGTTADFIPATIIPRDASYGRAPDGAADFAFFAVPTPGEANTTTAYGPPVAPPAFSHVRGFHDTAFNLELQHVDPEVSIRYTVDGSVPTDSNGATFSAAIAVSTTRIVRAIAVKPGALPRREIATHSFLFPDQIAKVTSRPTGFPASWGSFNATSYAFSPAVAAEAGYAGAMREALGALPVLSISASVDDLFGSGGVYSNPTVSGLEKEVSAEWIGLDQVPDFQINAGLRVQGGASRQFNNTPKKSLRLLFKSQYGDGRLRQPVLATGGGSATDDFNSIVLRADYNNSWLHWDRTQRLRGSLVRDQWMRDTQIEMSGSGASGNHVHLFLNGLYWGVYNPSERPDAAFAAHYHGGERDEYDGMTHDGVRDGNNIAWNAMRSLAQGGLASRQQYETIQRYLNIDHFIDYMIVNIYGGNTDWPGNNWNAVRKRETGAGYLFYCWDGERSLESETINRAALTGSNNPAEFYAALRQNAEFRLRFADRVHQHYFNGGALTPGRNIARYQSRAEVARIGLFAEQARWGAYRNEIYDRNGPSPKYAVNPHWIAERDRLINNFFPVRTANSLSHFRGGSLYPAVDAPSFSQHGGIIRADEVLTITSGPGVIYFQTDGSDPRTPYSGNVAPGAQVYSGPLTFADRVTLKARTLQNGVWSAINEANFLVELEEPVFVVGGTADWAVGGHWSGGIAPNGIGRKARIPAPLVDERNINLRVPVTMGGIHFAEAGSSFRERLRDRGTGNTLRFDSGGIAPAVLRVDGEGSGFVELEIEAGAVLTSDLELQVNHAAGSAENGALRLRADWSGPGGIVKTGLGVATLTGGGKQFSGAVEVRGGVLTLTEPATPMMAAGISVASGGQLRLVSGGAETRVYPFASALVLAGSGRDPGAAEGSGRSGALRYQPGSGNNRAQIPQQIRVEEDTVIHVEGSPNQLEIAGPIVGTSRLAKSGGGTLRLLAGSPDFTGVLAAGNGRVDLATDIAASIQLAPSAVLAGYGSLGPISGSGRIVLDGTSIRAPSASGINLTVSLQTPGSPSWAAPATSGNGYLQLLEAPLNLGTIRVYLSEPDGLSRGVLFAPAAADLTSALNGVSWEILTEDLAGTHPHGGRMWSILPDVRVRVVPETADFGEGPVAGQTLEFGGSDSPSPSFERWRELAFPDPEQLANPDISGPLADPFASGLSNLLRYAFGDDPASPEPGLRPKLSHAGGAFFVFTFPFDAAMADVFHIVEATADLNDWSAPEIWFDSRFDPIPPTLDGLLEIPVPINSERLFLRLRVSLKD